MSERREPEQRQPEGVRAAPPWAVRREARQEASAGRPEARRRAAPVRGAGRPEARRQAAPGPFRWRTGVRPGAAVPAGRGSSARCGSAAPARPRSCSPQPCPGLPSPGLPRPSPGLPSPGLPCPGLLCPGLPRSCPGLAVTGIAVAGPAVAEAAVSGVTVSGVAVPVPRAAGGAAGAVSGRRSGAAGGRCRRVGCGRRGLPRARERTLRGCLAPELGHTGWRRAERRLFRRDAEPTRRRRDPRSRFRRHPGSSRRRGDGCSRRPLRRCGRRGGAGREGEPALGLVGATLPGRRRAGLPLELLGLAQADPALSAQHEAERDGDQEYRHDDRDEDPQGLRGHASTLSRATRRGCPGSGRAAEPVRRSLSHLPSTRHTCCNTCDSPARCATAPPRVRRRAQASAALPGATGRRVHVRQAPREARRPAAARVRRRRARRRAGAARSRS